MILTLEHEGRPIRVAAVAQAKGTWISHAGATFFVPKKERKRAGGDKAGAADNSIHAPMTGRVVQIAVAVGDKVEAGTTLVVMEAMKMEYRLQAPRACRIAGVHTQAGDLVDLGALVVTLAP